MVRMGAKMPQGELGGRCRGDGNKEMKWVGGSY